MCQTRHSSSYFQGSLNDGRALLDLVRKADISFDLEWFAQNLDNVECIELGEGRICRITPDQLTGIKDRTRRWAAGIHIRARCAKGGGHLRWREPQGTSIR